MLQWLIPHGQPVIDIHGWFILVSQCNRRLYILPFYDCLACITIYHKYTYSPQCHTYCHFADNIGKQSHAFVAYCSIIHNSRSLQYIGTHCKATYVCKGFIFANSRILCASRKSNDAKIKFLYYIHIHIDIHIEYNVLAKLNPSESANMKHSLNLMFAKIYILLYSRLLAIFFFHFNNESSPGFFYANKLV